MDPAAIASNETLPMDSEIASNETPKPITKKKKAPAPPPPPPDYGPTPCYQSRWFIISGATIFFLAYFVAVVYLSITESTPVTATPTKAPTMAPTIAVNTTGAPAVVDSTTSPPPVAGSTPAPAPVAAVDQASLQIACDFIGEDISTCPTQQLAINANFKRGGTIPTEIGLLTALTFINFNGGNLTGTIPESMNNLKSLTSLTLSNNALAGTVPSLFCLVLFPEIKIDCGEISCTCCTNGAGALCP